jgi:hypothetical protein
LPDHPAARRRAGHLLEPAPQTEAGLVGAVPQPEASRIDRARTQRRREQHVLVVI